MKNPLRFIGGMFLIVGTSIGAGTLALPMVTAACGYDHAVALLIGAWLVMLLGALYILEVNLSLPEDSNLISMSRQMLGPVGALLTWIAYLLLLYTLLCAYTAGGRDLIDNLLMLINVHPNVVWSTSIFIIIFGTIVAFGVSLVDCVNRGLIITKLLVFMVLVALLLPHVQSIRLCERPWPLVNAAIMTVITSFGFATIIPTLRSYFESDVKKLRLAIIWGSFIPLACYLVWDFTVLGSVPALTHHGLIHMAHAPNAVLELTQALSRLAHNTWVSSGAHIFTSICVLTSFLGVALCLKDFLIDGLCLKKVGSSRHVVATILALLPPLVIVLLNPGLFIQALNYAGMCCVFLLALLPSLMAFSRRYVVKQTSSYQVAGGLSLILGEALIAVLLLLFVIWHYH